jgi:hypothetical protein
MAKQTKDKRAIRNCNSKDGQKQWQNRQGTKEQSEDVIQKKTKQLQNRQRTKRQSEDVIQRTDKTMAKQTRDKRAIRRCNSKDRQNNGKTDKGQKSNQKL